MGIVLGFIAGVVVAGVGIIYLAAAMIDAWANWLSGK
jgi:hypothetical protein